MAAISNQNQPLLTPVRQRRRCPGWVDGVKVDCLDYVLDDRVFPVAVAVLELLLNGRDIENLTIRYSRGLVSAPPNESR